ncbi:hypothetical protein RhiirC2_791045 [Rhizophagus irregularis]|uniref:Uncharacterized protein n=1 Tax=Rhizophagus irregularis TaxID=588596 RepID=A0A2N1MK12_9GLOM|nr:hypothetical protein RhiirC2_791045 [Rhizophagus irregularis]
MNHSNNISQDSSNQTFYSTNNCEESSFMENASTQSFPVANSSSYHNYQDRTHRTRTTKSQAISLMDLPSFKDDYIRKISYF